jgi:hypothetical protein
MDNIPEFLVQRYAHHAPQTQDRIDRHEALRQEFTMMAHVLESLLPPSREASIAHTHLQEASWAAHAALAIHEVKPETESP